MERRNHIFPTYAPPAIQFERGEGIRLWDRDGREYFDFISGISVNTLGHAHPDLVKALENQAQKLWHLSNMFDVPGQSELADRYCELTFADRVFFANSGAEAVECALKTARRYHFEKGDADRIEIIGFDGAFHGRTYATINAAGNPNYLKGFGPALPGYTKLPFGDMDALKSTLSKKTAAVIIEPVQGEGGLRPVSSENLRLIRKLCDEVGALLIYDEVQCGAGRTGKLFAHEWAETAAPDLMATAKGVGGGFPLGMCFATEEVAQFMLPGTHGTTYGGNALAVAVGHAVLDHLSKPEFLDNVKVIADQIRAGFETIQKEVPGTIEEIRGKGLLIGAKLIVPNIAVRNATRDLGLLIGVAGDNVVRLAPALNVTSEEVSEAMSRLKKALQEVKEAEAEKAPA
ncbi:aspartate aminotransferase family protein [Hirschia maritima]|uniref:aspartate aminotransferase family protein n=1 Tax=Hirschia maritima TaxID=1121961 RepID=UPI000379DD70|nr:aspartate aminotransferase family protein [Hirschia maritima]